MKHAANRMSRGRLRRAVRPLRVTARGGLRWLASFTSRGERRSERQKQALLRTSEDVTRTMGEMKGAVMKVGQILSMMTGSVPDELAGQLSSLHADAPPMAYELVESVFREDLGSTPQKLFARFEREPFAAASIGQVHRAWLADGTALAVKVQYPGVARAISDDLANIGVMLRMGGLVARGLDMGAIVDDLKVGIAEELDYCGEARRQQEFADRYAGHAFVVIPRVDHDRTTARILAQEYIAGRPFRHALTLPQPERDRIGEMIYRFSFGSIYRHGLFNGDPHPGNYLILDDGRMAFLDFGSVSRFAPETVAGFGRIIRALLAGDIDEWRAATEDLGLLHRNAPFTTEDLYEHMHWFWAPVLEHNITFTRELAAEMVRRNTQTTGHGGEINKHCNIPRGMVFLTRINFGLAGVLASLHATGPWRAIMEEYLLGAPPSSELGRASAASTRGPWI